MFSYNISRCDSSENFITAKAAVFGSFPTSLQFGLLQLKNGMVLLSQFFSINFFFLFFSYYFSCKQEQ